MTSKGPLPARASLLEQLAAAIAAVRLDHPTRVAIDGVDGSGKTMLADELVEPLRACGPRGHPGVRRRLSLSARRALRTRSRLSRRLLPRLVRLRRLEARAARAARWDLTIWLDVPFEVTVERAIARDGRNGGDAAVTRSKYEHRHVPGQWLYLTECGPRDRARIVVDNSVLDRPTIVVHRR